MNNLEIVNVSNSTRNLNTNSDFKKKNQYKNNLNDSKEKVEQTKKRTSKNSQKVRNVKNKRKKKILKQKEPHMMDKNNELSSEKKKDIIKNPFRKFLLYKLRKKYDAKICVYDIKKVNELIFNIPSHFTAIFKEYLLKEEEAEFLKRIYHKHEIHKKLKNIFYFYEKYSKIFPNYIVIPEGQYLYKNILKKQKMIDKLQRIKEEENRNKEHLSEASFNTIFTNGAIDSIYSNNADQLNNINLSNIISMDNIGKNEDQEILDIQIIIKNIENNEKFIEIRNMESPAKKQIIYKKEFRGLRSLSKSTNLQNGRDQKIKSKDHEPRRNNNITDNNFEKNDNKIRTEARKKNKNIYNIKNNINYKNYTGPSTKRSRESDDSKQISESESEESEEENENEEDDQSDSINMKYNKNIIKNYIKNSEEMNRNKGVREKYKKIKQIKEINKDKDNENDKSKKKEEDEIVLNKKKKFIVLRGSRHYFIKNAENDDKSLENTYTTDDKNLTFKSKNNIEPTERTLFYPKMKDYKNNNSFNQNKNSSKDYSIRHNPHFILYKKKVCNGRGLSISKKNQDFDTKRMVRMNTNFTTNGSEITQSRKYIINDQKNISIKKPGNNDEHQDRWKKIMNNNIFINEKQNNNNSNTKHYKTITYNYNDNIYTEQHKNNDSLNGNIYHKKYRFDNSRRSHTDKSCPKNYNKFLNDMELNKKKENLNHVDSIEDRSNEQSNAEVVNTSHRYYRTSQHNNTKKFKLRAPKNFYKIDFV